MPETKKGAKGISDFKFFFFVNTNPNPIIPPIKKEIKRETKILGNSRKRPKKIANLKSPNPIHFSFEIKIIVKKKKEGKMANPKLKI